MARLYADEMFPKVVVELLQRSTFIRFTMIPAN